MAVCSVTEFAAPIVAFGIERPVVQPPLVEQSAITIGAAVQSSAFDASTQIVRLAVEAQCYVSFGTDPTADANSIMLPAGAVEYFGIPKGQSYKVSVHDGVT